MIKCHGNSKRGSNCSALCTGQRLPQHSALPGASSAARLQASPSVNSFTKQICMSKGVYEASRLYAWRPAVFLIVRKLSLVFCCKHCSMETFLLTKNFSIFSSELGLNLGLALHNPPLCIFCYRDRFKDKQKFLVNLLLVALLKQWDFGQGDVQRSLSASAIL